MSLPIKPSRINFEAIDSHQLDRILKTGDVDSLTPAEREFRPYEGGPGFSCPNDDAGR